MRIFFAFLVLLCTAGLWMLPVSQAIYDFRTDARTDTFETVSTGAAETSADVTLVKELYDDDTETVDLSSDASADTPVVNSYATATRVLAVGGLSENTTRELAVTYDADALDVHTAVGGFLDTVPVLWILVLIAFPVVALWAIFTGRT